MSWQHIFVIWFITLQVNTCIVLFSKSMFDIRETQFSTVITMSKNKIIFLAQSQLKQNVIWLGLKQVNINVDFKNSNAFPSQNQTRNIDSVT